MINHIKQNASKAGQNFSNWQTGVQKKLDNLQDNAKEFTPEIKQKQQDILKTQYSFYDMPNNASGADIANYYKAAVTSFAFEAEDLKKADLNKDGKVTVEEYVSCNPDGPIKDEALTTVVQTQKTMAAEAMDFAYNADGTVKEGAGDGIIDARDVAGYYAAADIVSDGKADGKFTYIDHASVSDALTSEKRDAIRESLRATHNILKLDKPE